MPKIYKKADPCNIAGSYSFNGATLAPFNEMQRALVLFKNPKKGPTQRPYKIRFADSNTSFSGLRFTNSNQDAMLFDILESSKKHNYTLTISDCKTKAIIEYVY